MAATSNDAPPVYTGNVLSRHERRKLGGRKFGKYDFDQFRPLRVDKHFLGQAKIGEMDVACKFLFRKSRWGVLAADRNPGGIMYLDLVFTEPPGCYLRGATVILTLDENDKDLQRHFTVANKTENKIPVHITEHGPQNIVGQPKTREKLKTRAFMPYVNAGGFVELGGVGQESHVRKFKDSQWRFSSQTVPDRNGHGTTLRWDLSESAQDRQPKHPNTFHTAVAFEHDGQPFFIRVEVSGDLESTTSNLIYKTTNKFKKFKFPGEPQRATTLVNFGGRDNPYTQPLDEHAQMIPLEMVEANKTPVDQVQTLPTPQDERRESDPPDYQTVKDEKTSSYEVPISERDETAKMKENVLALMALPRANPNKRAVHNPYAQNQNLPATNKRSLSFDQVDNSFDDSSQTTLASKDETDHPKVVQNSAAVGELQKIRALLKDLGVLQALVQLVMFLAVLKIWENYQTSTRHRSSPTGTT